MPVSRRVMADSTLSLVAERFRILGDPFRLRLLQMLADREMSVGELVVVSQAAQANVSKQLRLLLQAGFVARRKEGLHVYYRIADPDVFRLCDVVCGSLTEKLSRELSSLRDTARPASKARRGRMKG